MRRKELEMLLEGIPSNPSPSAGLEQVKTPSSIASDALYVAHSHGDIGGRRVADLGCGTGILAMGASVLGAESVFAIDIDMASIETARFFADSIGVSVEWFRGDVSTFSEAVDTVIMNPPFGAQKRYADRPFLEKAIAIADVAYTFCLSNSVGFIESFARENGWVCVSMRTYKFPIPYTHPFHRKERKLFDVAFLMLSPMDGT